MQIWDFNATFTGGWISWLLFEAHSWGGGGGGGRGEGVGGGGGETRDRIHFAREMCPYKDDKEERGGGWESKRDANIHTYTTQCWCTF